jgi:hypothetical protein
MVVNFRVRGISRGARKLTRTPTLIKNKYNKVFGEEQREYGPRWKKKMIIHKLV